MKVLHNRPCILIKFLLCHLFSRSLRTPELEDLEMQDKTFFHYLESLVNNYAYPVQIQPQKDPESHALM